MKQYTGNDLENIPYSRRQAMNWLHEPQEFFTCEFEGGINSVITV